MEIAFYIRTLILFLTFWYRAVGAISWSCSLSKTTFVRRHYVGLSPTFLAEEIAVHESPPSECFEKCKTDFNCTGYFINHRNLSCVIFWEDPNLVENYLIDDKSSSYHRKICVTGTACNHQWAYDLITGVQLFRYDDKVLNNITSADHCMELCSTELSFTCRSAKFDKTSSECTLSRHDRRSAPEVFRKVSKEIIYLERQCVQEPSICQFRPRESRSLVHQHVQVIQNASTQSDCEQACLRHPQFPCRSFQFDQQHSTCLLSPEDSYSMYLSSTSNNAGIEKPFRTKEITFFEKESCIEVDIRCESTAMTAVVKVSTPFRGRVYAVGHPYNCYSVRVADDGLVLLSMPLHSRKCGTKNLGNGTFVNSIVVQHHPFVLRTSDRKIDVACDYEEMILKLRRSKGIRDGELKPLSHVVTAVAPTPPIRLRVVNATDQDVSGVELGDPLFLKVELTDESIYGIFGSDLVARSSAGSESVQLIDDNGCPVEPTVISALDRLPGSKSLVAPFQAFKFSSDTAVKFQMTVSYCLDTCPPVECEPNAKKDIHQKSYGRRKRATVDHTLLTDLQPGDIVSDVTMESAMFLVTNWNPSISADKQSQEWDETKIRILEPEGHVRILSPSKSFCMTLNTLYVVATIAGTFQLLVISLCAFLFVKRRDQGKGPIITSNNRYSVSSKQQLCDRL